MAFESANPRSPQGHLDERLGVRCPRQDIPMTALPGRGLLFELVRPFRIGSPRWLNDMLE